jgi:tetratricopeptide (TPR) repeat protein
MLASYSAPGVRSHILRFGLDKRATGGSCLANILWLQGHPRQALRAADTAFAEATRVNHSVSQFHVLISACCPIALAARDLATARRWLEALSDVSRRYKPWLAWLDCFRGILALREGDASSARALLERGLAVFPASSSSTLYCELLAELSAALQQLDLLEEADPLLERALDHAISHEVMQVLPDILRRKGELAWARTRDFGQAETLLRQAIEESQRQGALTSQLAGAASLGRILGETGRTAQAIDLLAPLCERWSDEPGLYPMSEARAVLSIVRGSAGG